MQPTTLRTLLLVVVGLFFAVLVLRLVLSARPTGRGTPGARERLREAKRRARVAGRDRAARAAALRDAAKIALDEINHPRLAAALAAHAERIDPLRNADAVELLSATLKRGGRFRALEDLLWRRLATDSGPSYERAFDELVALYEGPRPRPDRARALRALRR